MRLFLLAPRPKSRRHHINKGWAWFEARWWTFTSPWWRTLYNMHCLGFSNAISLVLQSWVWCSQVLTHMGSDILHKSTWNSVICWYCADEQLKRQFFIADSFYLLTRVVHEADIHFSFSLTGRSNKEQIAHEHTGWKTLFQWKHFAIFSKQENCFACNLSLHILLNFQVMFSEVLWLAY